MKRTMRFCGESIKSNTTHYFQSGWFFCDWSCKLMIISKYARNTNILIFSPMHKQNVLTWKYYTISDKINNFSWLSKCKFSSLSIFYKCLIFFTQLWYFFAKNLQNLRLTVETWTFLMDIFKCVIFFFIFCINMPLFYWKS